METESLLVFVNPHSGKGHAEREWNKAKVIFDRFELRYTVIMTTHQNHCFEYLSTEDLSSVKGIVLVSGDGLPHEAINALFKRNDWDKVREIPIGVLPGGSGNAFAKTVTHLSGLQCNSESCALLIAKGITRQFDLMCFEIGEQKIASFLSAAWAFIADVDLNSEHLRFLGGMRFDVYGAFRAFVQKSYRAILDGEEHHLSFFLVQKQPFISETYHSAPLCLVDDGYMDLQLLQANQWTGLVKLVLNQGSGTHVRMENETIIPNGPWIYKKVKEFTLEPLTNTPYSIDGERYEPKPLKAYVMPKILKTYCSI